MRLSITARLALLAIGLALISSLALAGLVWQQTHDDAIGELRRDTIERSDALVAVWSSGGLPALERAIAAARQDDDSLVAELVDEHGARRAGAGPAQLAFDPVASRPGFRLGVIAADGDWANEEGGFVVRRLGRDGWFVSGRLLDDWERAQREIERALVLAVLLAVVLGVGGAFVLTRYVSRRLDRIAAAVDAVGAGDLARRVDTGGGDAFDRLGQRINGMLGRIDGLVAELRVVTDSIAHDLRSPIARLRTRAEAAAAAGDPAQREAALNGLMIETELVTRMLGVLLEISRTETSPRDSLSPLDPVPLIEEIADLYGPVVEEAGLTFAIEAGPAPVRPVPIHRELLGQAVANLIDNAIRHAGGGGSVILSAAVCGEVLRIAVADRGPGIDPADRAEALRRFGRLDRARSAPGAGLGLALVEAVARLHGGRLVLEDNAPGLIAVVELPVR